VDFPVGLFVGDLQLPRKNLHTVLKALPACPGLHLAVVGRIGNSVFPAMARNLGVSDRVHFLDFRRDVPELMRSVDFVVFPSLYEPSGLVLLEAMASGVPVVTSASVGGLEASGTQGVLTLGHAENVDEISAAMRSLVEDPTLRRRMGQAGRGRALELDFRGMAAKYCDAFAASGSSKTARGLRPQS
jgi:glycosyltransferase involved in cell wall biosynthesis